MVEKVNSCESGEIEWLSDNHTEGVTDGYRAFFAGNALVCGLWKGFGQQAFFQGR